MPRRSSCLWFFLLQWGRNFIVAETRVIMELRSTSHMLQWGRNFIVAETAMTVLDMITGM